MLSIISFHVVVNIIIILFSGGLSLDFLLF